MYRVIEGKLLEAIQSIALNERPNEAVGLILPDDEVVQLENFSDTPDKAFAIRSTALSSMLKSHGWSVTQETLEKTTIWHSHPNGGVGPSIRDLRSRVFPFSFLVVSIQGEELTFSWY